MQTGKCGHCGVAFSKPRWGTYVPKFCSIKCAGLGKRGKTFERYEIRQCLVCSGEYTGHKRSKFCSQPCREFGARAGSEGFIRHLLKRTSRRKLNAEHVLGLFSKQQGKCAITGVEMTFDPINGRKQTNISIDRIDSSRGYEEGNVQLVCLVINLMKLNLSTAEFLDWCDIVHVNRQSQSSQRAA
jgi:hypothetical protein